MVYFAMAMALFAQDDYEEVAARLLQPLADMASGGARWRTPTSGGITQARQRLGSEPVRRVFERVAQPVAEPATCGAWLAGRRVVSVDGMVWDVPDSPENAGAFGYPSGTKGASFPQVRVVTLTESGTHAVLGAEIGPCVGKGTGERALARAVFARLEPGMLLLADRGFYGFATWCAAADTGADLLWRLEERITPTVVEILADGSFLALIFDPALDCLARVRVLAAVRAGRAVDRARARLVRVVEYDIPDRDRRDDRFPIRVITTILDPAQAPAAMLAVGYHQRWEHEGGNGELKTALRGPGRILRSRGPEMVRQEIYGYLLAHFAISALICRAATGTGIDPDRVKFTRTVRIIRRQVTASAAFSP